MNRRNFLSFSAASGLAPATQSSRPRNVLLLIADDLGLHTGTYGDPTAVTPNLDRLAREGVRFTNAFCTTASCSASRSVILSGLQNHANGQYGHAHAEHHFAYLDKVKPLSALLKDAGYRTGVIGKLHVNPSERFRWDYDKQGGGRNVYEMAQQAKAFIQSAGAASWYLHVGFTDPHRAANGFANRPYPGVQSRKFDPSKVTVPGFLPDAPPVREELAEYYEAIHRLDQGVGFFLDVLEQTKQAQNTLVIFISDNGMPFPNAKTNCYDAGLRLPLIVRAPGQSRRGLVNHAMVSWTDLTPTILDWAGAKGPDYPLHGKSWLPVLEQENPPEWDQIYFSHTFHEITMYYPVRGMRTKRYKYIHNLFPELEFPHASDLWASKTWQFVRRQGPEGKLGQRPVKQYLRRDPEELYDVTNDPNEVRNLAGSAQHQAILAETRRKVRQYRKETADPWMILDNYAAKDA